MTCKDRSELRILTPWHSTQEKGSKEKAGPACLLPWPTPFLLPPLRHELHKCGPWILHVQTPLIPTVNSHPIISS